METNKTIGFYCYSHSTLCSCYMHYWEISLNVEVWICKSIVKTINTASASTKQHKKNSRKEKKWWKLGRNFNLALFYLALSVHVRVRVDWDVVIKASFSLILKQVSIAESQKMKARESASCCASERERIAQKRGRWKRDLYTRRKPARSIKLKIKKKKVEKKKRIRLARARHVGAWDGPGFNIVRVPEQYIYINEGISMYKPV